jgi:hypothetical protein
LKDRSIIYELIVDLTSGDWGIPGCLVQGLDLGKLAASNQSDRPLDEFS